MPRGPAGGEGWAILSPPVNDAGAVCIIHVSAGPGQGLSAWTGLCLQDRPATQQSLWMGWAGGVTAFPSGGLPHPRCEETLLSGTRRAPRCSWMPHTQPGPPTGAPGKGGPQGDAEVGTREAGPSASGGDGCSSKARPPQSTRHRCRLSLQGLEAWTCLAGPLLQGIAGQWSGCRPGGALI